MALYTKVILIRRKDTLRRHAGTLVCRCVWALIEDAKARCYVSETGGYSVLTRSIVREITCRKCWSFYMSWRRLPSSGDERSNGADKSAFVPLLCLYTPMWRWWSLFIAHNGDCVHASKSSSFAGDYLAEQILSSLWPNVHQSRGC